VGILAALFAGAAYVPLNPRFPVQRNRTILERSNATALICDDRHRQILRALVEDLPSRPIIVLPEGDAEAPLDVQQLNHANLITDISDDSPLCGRGGNDIAYILFTSGSTGVPKGVPISHANVLNYIKSATRLSGITSEDRNIQPVDLTFDLSVHDMFMTWLNGASLFSVPENAALLAARFVEEHKITGWLSVPSTAGLMKQAGTLTYGSMPSLRYTFFCGEPLSVCPKSS
jgi:non-ribosomal peptide synthetase component F